MKLLLPIRCIAFVISTFFTLQAAAQTVRHAGPRPSSASVKTTSSTGFSGTGANIDVVYHRAEWRVNPDSTNPATGASVKAISGSVTTYFKTVTAGVASVTFDLNNVFTVSATYHGSAITVTRPVANQIRLALPVTLPANRLDSVTIVYSGVPPATAESGAAVGFQKATYNATTPTAVTQNYIYTLSESYEDRDWWPCKADMQDKIDSMDIIVSTRWSGADTFWVATNGKLMESPIRGVSRIFKYKTRYPIASYLVSLGVARYNRYSRSVNIGGTNTEVAYYLFRGKPAATYTAILTAMDNTNLALTAFSNKFGDYPFKNEKHGFYEGLGGAGGMEHQTFSAIATSSISHVPTLVHELMHQWFGDKVTFATWNHLWLAEGPARYSESLVGELVPALGINPVTERTQNKNTTRGSYSTTNLVIPPAGIASSGAIWNGTYGGAVYEKGAMIISMLRKLVGDTRFYQAMTNYLNDPALAYKAAVTDDLKNHFEAVAGYDLDPFFNKWIYGVGHADFAIKWNNSGKRIAIQVGSQTKSTGATTGYFPSPVVLKISNGLTGASLKDTMIVIYAQAATSLSYAGRGILPAKPQNTLAYDLSFVPAASGITFDPNAETLSNASVAPAKDATINPFAYTTLPATILDFKGQKNTMGNSLSLLIAPTEEKLTVTAERSEDGAAFYNISEMTKTAVTEKGRLYNFEDRIFSNAHAHHYRARIVDEKGIVNYSRVIVLKNSSETTVGADIHPNVVSNILKIFLSNGWENDPVSITVYNSAGMAVRTEKRSGATQLQLSLHQLPAGNYTIAIRRTDGQTATKRFAIVR